MSLRLEVFLKSLKSDDEKSIGRIPEIAELFESSKCEDKIMVNIIKSGKSASNIVKDFERLDSEFQHITALNALHKSRFSNDIYFLQTHCWSEIIYIIKDEILHNYQGSQILENEGTISLINKNFDMVNHAVEIEKLIN